MASVLGRQRRRRVRRAANTRASGRVRIRRRAPFMPMTTGAATLSLNRPTFLIAGVGSPADAGQTAGFHDGCVLTVGSAVVRSFGPGVPRRSLPGLPRAARAGAGVALAPGVLGAVRHADVALVLETRALVEISRASSPIRGAAPNCSRSRLTVRSACRCWRATRRIIRGCAASWPRPSPRGAWRPCGLPSRLASIACSIAAWRTAGWT